MSYRLIVHDHSATGTYHQASAAAPRCTGRDRPGFRVLDAETIRDVARLAFREGLKVGPCPTCRPEDLST